MGQRLRRLHVDRLRLGQGARRRPRSPTCSSPSSRARSPSTATRPRPARRSAACMMASIANGGSADDIAPGVDFFGKLKKAGNFLPVDPTPATIESGQTPVVIDWDYLNAAETKPSCRPGRWWSRARPSSPATTSRRSTRTPRTRRPRGCGRSSSTATRARTSGSRAAPVRSARDAMAEAGTIDQALCDALPPVEGTPVDPDRRADRGGRDVPRRQLGQGRRLTMPPSRGTGRAGGSPSSAVPGRCCRSSRFPSVFLIVPTVTVVVGAFHRATSGFTLGNVRGADLARPR